MYQWPQNKSFNKFSQSTCYAGKLIMVYSIKKRKREKPSYCNFHAKKNEKEYVVTSVIPTLKHASNHPSQKCDQKYGNMWSFRKQKGS